MTSEQSRSSLDVSAFTQSHLSRRAVLGGLAFAGVAAAATSVPGLAAAGPRDRHRHYVRRLRRLRRCQALASYGDRNLGTVANYPPPVFKHVNPDAHFIDITKVEESLGAPAGTNAVANDPNHDCSTAFNFALDWLADLERPLGTAATQSLDTTMVIYVPAGTFYVQHPIRYTGAALLTDADISYWVHMRIVGRSRGGSIIRAVDNAADFAAGQNRAVVDFPRDARFNNWEAQTVLRHLTVHTGSGNPGATAVKFYGANNAHIENVRLVSGDGAGRAGLDISIGIGSGYVQDVRIEGFDYGITMQKYHFICLTMEYLTLRNQRIAGIRVTDCLPSIRSVDEPNTCPAVLVDGDGANVVLLDSKLASPSTVGGPAIDVTRNGQVFVRDVVTSRYGSAVRRLGTVTAAGPTVAEYVSGGVQRFDAASSEVSLSLPVADTPALSWPTNSGWANVDAYGAVGDGTTDDSDAIEQALNAGRAVVYFPSKAYRINRTLSVPPGVRRLAFLFSSPTSTTGEPMFEVTGTPATALTIEDVHRIQGAPLVKHTSTRRLVLSTIRGGGPAGTALYLNNPTGANGDLFLNNANGLKTDSAILRRQKVWARWINTESKATPNFGVGDGATVWVLGFKTEGGSISFDVTSGGRLEVLGGICNQYAQPTFNDGVMPDLPFRVVNGEVSLVAASNGPDPATSPYPDAVFTTVVDDTQGGTRREVMWDDLPVRAVTPGEPARAHQWVLPLYVN